ncbi:hypothetical protein [Polaromonas sp. SM01]|uniref:hypothetical protein n=1 Tax=Polaromonas sp. SM01 TaxID=3085630 RepID=UPI003990D3A8
MPLPHRPLLSSSVCWLALLLGGCSNMGPASVHRGETQVAPLTVNELVQSDVNRVATLGMRDNLDSLYRLLDKLYRRNPTEWRKTSAVSRDAAVQKVREAITQRTPWPELKGQRDIAALSLALAPDFKGDRVAAFIYASADMLIVAHDNRSTFYLVDGLDAQHIYNAARNIESAVWLLASRRNTAGQPLLLADEISAQERNLSFEREFGKVIGRLDLLSEVLTEKYRRAVISYVQNLAGASFLQFLPVR